MPALPPRQDTPGSSNPDLTESMSEPNAMLSSSTYVQRKSRTPVGNRDTRTENMTTTNPVPESVTIVIEGDPIAKGRPRFTRTGRVYTDARTRQAENTIRAAWLTQATGREPHVGPVSIRIQFVFQAPVSWPKWRRDLAQYEGQVPHLGRPDVDNLVKAIKDGLNGLAWVDDSQVTRLMARKDYGPASVTRIMLTLFNPPSPTKKGTTK